MKSAKSDGSRLVGKSRRILAALLLDVMAVTLFAGFTTANTTYVITDGDTVTTVRSYASNVPAALSRAGILLSPTDRVYTWSTDRAMEVEVQRGSKVTVHCDGATVTTTGYSSETVGQLLERMKISVGGDDLISVSADTSVDQSMEITVTRRTVTYETVTEEIPYETQRVADSSAYQGTEQVVQEGSNGQKTLVYRTSQVEGGEPVTVLAEETVTVEAVDQIVSYGTKARPVALSALSVTTDAIATVEEQGSGGVLTTLSGQQMSYSKVITCTATAYTCEGKSWRTTATGTTARVGAIAVDPSVIPYGTRMYIVSSDGSIVYGVATAEDCGGSIKGNRIDLYFDTYQECIQFGRRSCTVYVLD